MSARDAEARLQLAERAYVEDIVREHGYVGALRLALRIVERVLSPMSPPEMRDGWIEAVQRPLADTSRCTWSASTTRGTWTGRDRADRGPRHSGPPLRGLFGHGIPSRPRAAPGATGSVHREMWR